MDEYENNSMSRSRHVRPGGPVEQPGPGAMAHAPRLGPADQAPADADAEPLFLASRERHVHARAKGRPLSERQPDFAHVERQLDRRILGGNGGIVLQRLERRPRLDLLDRQARVFQDALIA